MGGLPIYTHAARLTAHRNPLVSQIYRRVRTRVCENDTAERPSSFMQSRRFPRLCSDLIFLNILYLNNDTSEF